MRARLLKAAGLVCPKAEAKAKLDALTKSEWSSSFETLMRNRLIMGALRYGTIAENQRKANQKRWDVIGAIANKVRLYEETGNTEHLVDAANYCLLTFLRDPHPNKNFTPLDDTNHCQAK
jgi:hypothetical protein